MYPNTVPNPLYRGQNKFQSESSCSAYADDNESEGIQVMTEFRGFKPYLLARLQYIRESGRVLELDEEVKKIQLYLDVMSDIMADRNHGVEGLRGFISQLNEMTFKNPISKPFKKETRREEPGIEEGSVLPETSAAAKLRNRYKKFGDWVIDETLKKEGSTEMKRDNWYYDVLKSSTAASVPPTEHPSHRMDRVEPLMINQSSGYYDEVDFLRNAKVKRDNWYYDVLKSSTTASVPTTEHPSHRMDRVEPLMINQSSGYYDEVDFLRNAEPEMDIISVAGISDLVERREKKVKSILKPVTQTVKKPVTPLSQLREKFEKDRKAIFKLGSRNSNQEMIEEPIVSSSSDEETPKSPPSPPSPQKDEDEDLTLQLELIKEILTTHGKKKETAQLLKNPEKLKKFCKKIKSDIIARKKAQKTKSSKPASPRPPKKSKPTRKSSGESELSLNDIHDKLVNGFSSESETGTVVSSVSTRSSTRKQIPSSSCSNESTCPKRTTRFMDQPSTSVNDKPSTSSRPSPPPRRKRVVAPLPSSSESEEEQEAVTSTSSSTEETPAAAPAKDKQHGNIAQSRVREVVEELRMENLKNRKKSRVPEGEDCDPAEMSRRQFASRTTKEGRTVVGRNDILVCPNMNKINLGCEENSGIGILSALKKETVEKQEPQDDMDIYEDDISNDPFILNACALAHVKVEYGLSDREDVGIDEVVGSEALETQGQDDLAHVKAEYGLGGREDVTINEAVGSEALESQGQDDEPWLVISSVEGSVDGANGRFISNA